MLEIPVESLNLFEQLDRNVVAFYRNEEIYQADGTSYEAVKCFLTKESAEQYNDSKKPVSPANLAYLQAFWGKAVIIEPHRNYWIEFK